MLFFLIMVYLWYACVSTNQNLPYYSPCMQEYNQLNNRVIHTKLKEYSDQ
jgi:hypothetical protein